MVLVAFQVVLGNDCAVLLAGWLVTLFGGIGNAAAVMSLIYIVGLIATPFAEAETRGKPLPA